MEEILNNYSLNEILFIGILLGYIFSFLENIIQSIADYTREKAWLVNNYEEIIYENVGIYEYSDELNKKKIVCQAINNHKKRLDKRKKIDNFFNKFKCNFKREQT